MRSLKPRAAQGARRGPGPSRIGYRLERIWKRAWVRRLGLSVLPAALIGVAAWQAAISPTARDEVQAWKSTIMESLSARPEFAVHGLAVSGASEDLVREIEEIVPIAPGLSSLDLDVAAIQSEITAIGKVRSAHVKLAPGGMLQVAVTERLPRALWRDDTGRLWLVDREGVVVAGAATRVGYPELPVVLGTGAPAAMPEALAILRAAPDLRPRLRALVRVGQRRWNLALDRGVTIMLPEEGAADVLGRVVAWQVGTELLNRDVVAIDLRLPDRPTVRMTGEGARLFQLRRAAQGTDGEDT